MQPDDPQSAAPLSSLIPTLLDAIKVSRKLADESPGGRFASIFADRSKWGSGPWDEEPDRFAFITQAGLRGLVVRCYTGAWCGYVAVGPSHPCHSRGQMAEYTVERDEKGRRIMGTMTKRPDIGPDPTEQLSVHGGVTYADASIGRIAASVDGVEVEDLWWIGFDCSHAWDIAPGLQGVFREAGVDPSVGALGEYRTLQYACGEVELLAEQLAAMKSA